MQLGFVWLGKMGVKVVRRIQRHSDHTVITFDVDPDAVRTAAGYGAIGARSWASTRAGGSGGHADGATGMLLPPPLGGRP
jgi:6-phosphogluconate dehydrogenase (decarboxylating)